MGGSLLSQGGLLLLPHKCTCQGMHDLWVGGGQWGVTEHRLQGAPTIRRHTPQRALGGLPLPTPPWRGPVRPATPAPQGDGEGVEAPPQRQALI